jgi:Mg/Co/Ni transporter MgtE
MYADPTLIRDHPVRVYFNESEAKLVDALTEYTGEQRAVLIRKLILDQAAAILSGQADYDPNRQIFEQPQQGLNRP